MTLIFKNGLQVLECTVGISIHPFKSKAGTTSSQEYNPLVNPPSGTISMYTLKSREMLTD